jgi:hypothetical protein
VGFFSRLFGGRNGKDGSGPAARPAVIGVQMAQAHAAEQQRLAQGNVPPSPMPEGSYPRDTSELGLLRPREVDYDGAIAALARRYARADELTRADMRRAISMGEFYQLITFSKRSTVFALRERSEQRVRDGLAALAMIEVSRVDWRDIAATLGMLHDAANRVGARADVLLSEAGRLGEPEFAATTKTYITAGREGEDLFSAAGYRETVVDGQIGLVRRNFSKYEPSKDLIRPAVQVAELLAHDKYFPRGVTIADDPPKASLSGKDDARLTTAMSTIRAVASVHADLRPEAHPDAAKQRMWASLAETTNASAAESLAEISQIEGPLDCALLGAAEGNLFCLMVARSIYQGVDSFETRETLSRFSDGLHGILRDFAKAEI